jgi:fructosamine-3-kinase
VDSYDENLDRAVWALSNQRLEWNKVLAQKRRGVPQDVEVLMKDVLERQRLADQELYAETLHTELQSLPAPGESAILRLNEFV